VSHVHLAHRPTASASPSTLPFFPLVPPRDCRHDGNDVQYCSTIISLPMDALILSLGIHYINMRVIISRPSSKQLFTRWRTLGVTENLNWTNYSTRSGFTLQRIQQAFRHGQVLGWCLCWIRGFKNCCWG
jgi:hypothetical protein